MTQKKELENLLERFSLDLGTPKFKPGTSNRGKGEPFVPGARPDVIYELLFPERENTSMSGEVFGMLVKME